MRKTLDLSALPAAINLVNDYAALELSPSTQHYYLQRLKRFITWTQERDLIAIGAKPETVLTFFEDITQGDLRYNGLQAYHSVIRRIHEINRLDDPTRDPHVVDFMLRMRRERPGRPRGSATMLQLADLISVIPDHFLGKRDKALILTMFFGALLRFEHILINRANVREIDDGLLLAFDERYGKYRRARREVFIGSVPEPNSNLCPVRAIKEWMVFTGTDSGPLFPSFSHGGGFFSRPLNEWSVGTLISKYARLLPASSGYSPATLRKGFILEATRAGVKTLRIMRQANFTKFESLLAVTGGLGEPGELHVALKANRPSRRAGRKGARNT